MIHGRDDGDELHALRTAVDELRQESARRDRATEILSELAEATSWAVGDDFFSALVERLAKCLDVKYVFIAESVPGVHNTIRTLAFYAGESADNFDCDVTDGPCEQVVKGNVVYEPRDVRSVFPKNQALVQLQAESYYGIPLLSRDNHFLGHLCIMDDKPMDEDLHTIPGIKLFAQRAAAELER